MIADVFALDTTYRMQIWSDYDGTWNDYSQAEYTSADDLHDMATRMHGGLKPHEYRLIEVSRDVIENEPVLPDRAEAILDLAAPAQVRQTAHAALRPLPEEDALNTMPDRLRQLYEYATTHRVFDLGLLLDAAAEIEQLEQRLKDKDEYIAELEHYDGA